MAIKALVLNQTIDFVSSKDPALTKKFLPIDPDDISKGEIEQEVIEEDATKFKLRPLDVFLMGYIYDTASILSGKQGEADIDIKTRVNATNIDAVRFGLAGIENFLDAEGKPIKFRTEKVRVNGREYDAVSDSIMRMFGVQLVSELAGKIKDISEVTAAQEKN